MTNYINTNPAFGHEGPFSANSPEEASNDLNENFRVWAEEAYFDCDEEGDRDVFIENAVQIMREEFIRGLVVERG